MKKITINGEYTLEEIQKMFEEKTILKYHNGAVVESLEDEQPYFYIEDSGAIEEAYYSSDYLLTNHRLLTRNVFLSEEEAEKEAKRQIRYFEIINNIEKINREEGWVADWNDNSQAKWHLYYYYENMYNRFFRDKTYSCRQNGIYMCKKAIDWVMNLPDEDKKILIGIYD